MTVPTLRRVRNTALASFLVLLPLIGGMAPAVASGSHALVEGSGSSWSANAINQWIADVQQNGLQVVFTANGSAQGRKDFANNTTDFALSDIGYQGSDALTGDPDTPQGRAFSYLPVVAGGTSFPYQVKVGGQLVRNLRLSGRTLTKIFTNQITDWSDPAITADNNGHALPALPIIPVVHSEGSGSTAQFTRYLAKQFPSDWKAYSGQGGLTEYYPRKGSQIAQNGSDGVMNFVASGAANGAIGYDEYSYALAKNFPVAKIENSAGYYTAPTQYNVAVALTQAQINMDKSSQDYLLQNLDNVYTYSDIRTYPLSSYSYMLIPTASNDPRMSTAKRQTLADFLDYSVCTGQAEMGPIGYSPLPINLAQASFDQVKKLHDADPNVDVTQSDVRQCNNPTFDPKNPSRNYLAEIAPNPDACDKSGAGPCNGSEGLASGNPQGGQVTTAGPPTTGKHGSAGGSLTPTAKGQPGTRAAAGLPVGPTGPISPAGSAAPVVDPLTGQVSAPTGTGAGTTASAAGLPTVLSADPAVSMSGVLGPMAVLEVLAVVIAPPLLAQHLRARRRS